MQNRNMLVALTLGLGLTLALGWLLGGGLPAQAALTAELQVCPSGCAYASIQAAVDAANPGDVVQVAQGTYTDIHTIPSLNTPFFTAAQVVAITKPLTLRGGYSDDFAAWDPATYPTILDAQGQGRVVCVVGYIAPTIEGLHITGGNSAGLGGSVYGNDAGGGIHVLGGSAVISGNQVYGNSAYRAGGVWLQDSTATLRGNTIRDNVAEWAGGALWLYNSPATLQANDVVSNTAPFAGGVALHQSDATLRGNSVFSNTATSSEGGGLMLLSSNASLDGNLIRGNWVGSAGGGLYLNGSDATLINNVITDNYANSQGSGVYVSSSSPHLIHTTIARNEGDGGGLYATSSTPEYASHVMMTNTIVISHTEGIIAREHNTVTLHATLWYSNATDWAGYGAIHHTHDHFGHPAFAADGYHLTASSAAIGRGVNAGVTADIDGDRRPQGARYDLGADEFPLNEVYLPLAGKGRP